MERAEWQRLAEERVCDAVALLSAGRWSGAYYMAGYAVEFGLKSCVVARVSRTPGLVYGEKGFSQRCWTHDLESLVALADLATIRAVAIAANADLGANWQIVKDWSEEDRFRWRSEPEARKMIEAVTESANGVLQWIKNHW